MQNCEARLQHPEFTCPTTTSEDCLYLNVYTPTTSAAHDDGASLLPVLFWIHGGNFIVGAGGVPFYHGGRFAATQKLVVVTINYRLGAFGT